MIAADAGKLIASTQQHWYKVDGVNSFIGVLQSWVADECRLGNGPEAWQSAEQQVEHGLFRSWFVKNEPHYIAKLRSDLVSWGYCSANA